MMKLVLLLALLSVGEGGSSSVIGRTGQSVTLPCKYDITYYKTRSFCWNRGDLPSSGCNNKLISTGSYNETGSPRASSRYQLLGRLDEGNISLTILNITEEDAGRYGCRVDIPGWFNDQKHHFDLTVERAAETTTSPTPTSETTTETTASVSTAGQLTSTETILTSSSGGAQAEQENGGVLLVVLVFVLFGLVTLVTAGGLVIIARRWRQRHKISQQQQQVHFSSTMQLHNRGSAVENIYQIDGGGDGGEYEYCP